MSDTIWDIDTQIGRPSVPRTADDVPASGVSWNGPTEFVVTEERPGAFRWVMVSGDARQLKLARSPSLFASADECVQEVKRLDPISPISFSGNGQ